jgi:methyl-accepting chemotaxis protein
MANEIKPTGPVITNSLIKRFRRSIIWLYVVTIAISIPIVYFTTQHQVYAEANKELSLLVDMVASVREYIAKDVRPGLLQANMFESPAISSTVTTSVVAGRFKEKRPDYYIKVASDNPLSQKNLPEPLETELLAKFRADKELKGITEVGEIKGNTFLVSARPSIAHQECMICHGDPKKAPMPVTSKYGMTSGYNYQPDSVVGTIGVGVPLADVNTLVMQRGLVVVGIITVIFSLIFIIINALVKKTILSPITSITEAAIVLSKGDLDREINIKQDGSEIGELANSFELLRRSLKWTMEQSK